MFFSWFACFRLRYKNYSEWRNCFLLIVAVQVRLNVVRLLSTWIILWNMADYPNCKLSTSPSLLVCAHRITIDLLLQCDCSAALRFEPYYHQFKTKHSLHSVKIITVTTSVISYAFCHFRLTILSAETNNHILNNKSSVLLSQIYPINIDLFCLN